MGKHPLSQNKNSLASETRSKKLDGYRRSFWARFQAFFYDKDSSTQEIQISVAIGIFFGLNSLIGTHFYLILLTVYLAKIFLKKKLSVGLAYLCSYILNPLTIIPLFSLFYWSGLVLYKFLGLEIEQELTLLGIQGFLGDVNRLPLWEGMQKIFHFFFLDLGLPILIGSFPIGIAGAMIGFYGSGFFLRKHRDARDATAS